MYPKKYLKKIVQQTSNFNKIGMYIYTANTCISPWTTCVLTKQVKALSSHKASIINQTLINLSLSQGKANMECTLALMKIIKCWHTVQLFYYITLYVFIFPICLC